MDGRARLLVRASVKRWFLGWPVRRVCRGRRVSGVGCGRVSVRAVSAVGAAVAPGVRRVRGQTHAEWFGPAGAGAGRSPWGRAGSRVNCSGGLRLRRAGLGFLVLGVLLGATAVASAGTIGFVGPVAPHAARSLVGRRHVRVVPVAVLLGARLVRAADLPGRTVIAPAQLGAGLMTAVIGTPYFLRLLLRTRR
ncbi:iron chelate uptake ABC transporter family permease subunit [Streptomyces scabiei]|uniref:Putative siderophore transport system permease protein n=1 Tax=Streptomyces scabiei TaxID=1930 RepID=A0A100JRF8_STRSC|nr:iron chelate uptake ABC transporter family permease subunit [Streptomyces scabiei]GAQ64324.1 putative siderophore transport system permease protein [Streptomyces scabiei]